MSLQTIDEKKDLAAYSALVGLQKDKALKDAQERFNLAQKTFEVLNKAYDLVVAYYEQSGQNRDFFIHRFSGIADDYKMAKLHRDVAQDELQKLSK